MYRRDKRNAWGVLPTFRLFLGQAGNSRGAGTLGPRLRLKLNGLSFLEGFEAVGLNDRIMDKIVLAVVSRHEAKPLFGIKPLNATFERIAHSATS